MGWNKNTIVQNATTSKGLQQEAIAYHIYQGNGLNDQGTTGQYVLCYLTKQNKTFADVVYKHPDCDVDDVIQAVEVDLPQNQINPVVLIEDSEYTWSPETAPCVKLLEPIKDVFVVKNKQRQDQKSRFLHTSMDSAQKEITRLCHRHGLNPDIFEILPVTAVQLAQNVSRGVFQGI